MRTRCDVCGGREPIMRLSACLSPPTGPADRACLGWPVIPRDEDVISSGARARSSWLTLRQVGWRLGVASFVGTKKCCFVVVSGCLLSCSPVCPVMNTCLPHCLSDFIPVCSPARALDVVVSLPTQVSSIRLSVC